MLKQWGCLLLALLLLPMLPGLSEESKTYVMAGYDDGTTYRDWSSNLFFARMQERTGVQFTYQQYTEADKWQAAKASMTAGASMPDVLFKAELSSAECIAMLERGALLDLAPLLEENCPNLSALLAEHPDWRDAITLQDGRIAALPYINLSPMQNIVWVNQTWLGNLKLSMPTDAESLVAVLTAFKEGDPNRNGKRDEIPLAFLGPYDLKYLAHAFGLTANDYNVFAKDGKAYFMPLEESFRPFIEWCRALYAKGLLDKNGFSTNDSLRRVTDEKATKVYGMLLTTMVSNILPSSWTSEYVAMPPLAYQGTQTYRSIAGQVLRGTFAITSECQDPAAMLRWVDVLYGDEGSKLASVGQEGVDYIVDGDGTWRISEAASANTYFTAETLITSGSTPPGISNDAFQRAYSDTQVATLANQIQMVNEIAALPFPVYDLTDEQLAYISPLQSRIGKCVDTSIAKWVLGEVEISGESFAAFEDELKGLGLDEFMAFWQTVLDEEGAQ